MRQKVSEVRWKKAQSYEYDFWDQQVLRTAGDHSRYDWYQQRAHEISEQARPLLHRFEKVRALEIGSGPIGVIPYFSVDERFALDPLNHYYCTREEYVSQRSSDVTYVQGTGEDISKLGKEFQFIVIDNVLDHVMNPGRVLDEIHKNLVQGGIMYISLNIYTRFGRMLRTLIELFEIDKGHPFSFCKASIEALIQGRGFEILVKDIEDYGLQKRKYRKSNVNRAVLKSYLGLTDYRYSAFCRK